MNAEQDGRDLRGRETGAAPNSELDIVHQHGNTRSARTTRSRRIPASSRDLVAKIGPIADDRPFCTAFFGILYAPPPGTGPYRVGKGPVPCPPKEHIANGEQIVYTAAYRHCQAGEAPSLPVLRIPAIRSTPYECSASSRRRIAHGQIAG